MLTCYNKAISIARYYKKTKMVNIQPQDERNLTKLTDGRTVAALEIGYTFGQNYNRPLLSAASTTVGGYTRDPEAICIDHAEERLTQKITHKTILGASVGGRFTDSARFTVTSVFLEILQNAQPRDSKGTNFDFQFYARGTWHPVVPTIAEFGDGEIKGIRIIDNGKGYLATDAVVLGGGKREDPESFGNFGSGMKLSDRSATEEGLQVTRYSQNWKGVPHLIPVMTSAGRDATVHYEVNFFETPLPGSVVEYRNLSTKALRVVRNIADLYLPLDPSFPERLLSHTEKGLILTPKNNTPTVMVGGRIYTLTVPTEQPFLFSYDLHKCLIDDQNRYHVDTQRALDNIEDILELTTNEEIYEKIMRTALADELHPEHDLHGVEPQTCFWEAAKKVYNISDEEKEKTYLVTEETNEKENRALQRHGYKPLVVGKSKFIKETFHKFGIPTSQDVLTGHTEEIPCDYIENYKEENFALCACRAALLLEKLPPDAKEMIIVLEDGTQMAYDAWLASDQTPPPVQFIVRAKNYKFREKGWHAEFPGILHPLFTAAAVIGAEITVITGCHEVSDPKTKGEYCRVVATHRQWPLGENHSVEITIDIQNPSQAGELKTLYAHCLNLDPNYKPFERTTLGDIVAIDGGKIYKQGIVKETSEELLCSYNIPADNYCTSSITNATNRPEVPLKILTQAKEDPQRIYEEFKNEYIPRNPQLWLEAFHKIFGQRAVIDDLKEDETILRDRAEGTIEKSGFKKVNLPGTLNQKLKSCGVKGAREKIETKTVLEHTPTPAEQALLLVQKIIDEAIQKCISDKTECRELKVRVARSVRNADGDEIRSGKGYYRSPTRDDYNIYLLEDLLKAGDVETLTVVLARRTIENYAPYMEEEEYLLMKSRVLTILDVAFTPAFNRKFKKAARRSMKKTTQIVERTIGEIELPVEEEEPLFPPTEPVEKKWNKLIRGIRELLKGLRRKSDTIKTFEKAFPPPEGLQVIDFEEASPPPERPQSFITPIRAAIFLICAATGIVVLDQNENIGTELPHMVAQKAAVKVEEPEEPSALEKLFNELTELVDGIAKRAGHAWNRPTGENRTVRPDYEKIDVGIDRNLPQTEALKRRAEFISQPALKWGYFMAEKTEGIYDGEGWGGDANAPQFVDPQWSEVYRISHMQILREKEQKVQLRRRAGGLTDPTSIKVIREDQTETTDFTLTPLPNGEYEVDVPDRKAIGVMYETVSPVNWEAKAESLTDADFQKLDPTAYAYYTQVPPTDLTKIKFPPKPHIASLNGITTLQEFIDYLRTKKPFERIRLIRYMVENMRYTRTEQTEIAFAKFHKKELPEQDFLTFIFNSELLEQPGDGDCDVQNSIFALLTRLAGVPTRETFVYTNSGAGHGPAEVYLPTIGWVLMDTMGTRTIEENVNSGNDLPDSRRSSNRDFSQDALKGYLLRRAEYEKRECSQFED